MCKANGKLVFKLTDYTVVLGRCHHRVVRVNETIWSWFMFVTKRVDDYEVKRGRILWWSKLIFVFSLCSDGVYLL